MEQENKKQPKLKLFLHRAFESHNFRDPVSLCFDIFYIVLVLVSVVFSILEVTELWERVPAFEYIEYLIVALFAFEWFSCLYTADIEYTDVTPFKARLKWIISLESIIDIICLIVFIISLIPIKNISYEVDLFLRLIVLIKLLRVLKWIKYFKKKKHHKEEQKEAE